MKNKVALTCAITGSGNSHLKHPDIPKSPEEIASAAIKATKAGASIIHIHVRNPETGEPCRELKLYEETVKLIRSSDVDVVINITTGMGGDWVPDVINPAMPANGTDMATPYERMEHILKCRPEICTIDCGSYNIGQNMVYVATLNQLRESTGLLLGTGITPEIEAFDFGFLWQAKILISENLLPKNTLFQLCMGVPYGAEATTSAILSMRDHIPKDYDWCAFGIGRDEFPMLAQAFVMGGNVRVGLEDNIYLKKGQLASNDELVEKGKDIIESLGGSIMTPFETREAFRLIKQ